MDDAALTCERCRAPVAATAKFCAECGAPLVTQVPAAEVRKTVTALFCDVTGSTEMGERLDPEAQRATMERYFSATAAVVQQHGGTVEKYVGDAVMAVFGVPVAHEDDALRACRAALDVQRSVSQLSTADGRPLDVRVGVESGEVLVAAVERGSTFASGPAVNLAARLQAAAAPGECLIGPACLRLVRDHVSADPVPGLSLKGLAMPVDAARLVDVGPAEADRPSPVTPMVGRQREQALLAQALDRAVADRTCQLVTVLGVAGIGKSRLAAEFASGQDGISVLRTRCLSYGESAAWWPVVQLVRQLAGLSGEESADAAARRLHDAVGGAADRAEIVDRLRSAAGLGGEPGSPEDVGWALRRLLEELAQARPVVLVVDDLHWAELALRTALQHVCRWLRDAPVVVLVLCRPEFLDAEPTWGGGRMNALSFLLEPLSETDLGPVVGALLGGEVEPATARAVHAIAGGNPLYLEHLLRFLVEDGLLVSRSDQWTLTGAPQVPPSVAALIQARLDLLSSDDRLVLGAAAVMGQVFYPAALARLLPEQPAGATLLDGLLDKGLLRPSASDLPAQRAMAFHHLLVRDAAYSAQPKSLRADLHERFARWLDETAEGDVYDGFVGGHLESAYQARVDLGRLDDATRKLGREAADRLTAAADELWMSDHATAVDLLHRADRLIDETGTQRFRVLLEILRASAIADPEGAARVAERLLREATAAGELESAAIASVWLQLGRMLTEPGGASQPIRAAVTAALPRLLGAEHHAGLADVYFCLSNADQMDLDAAASHGHLLLAADHAASAGRHRTAAHYRLVALISAVGTGTPADVILADTERALPEVRGRAGRALCLATVAASSLLLGRAGAAEAAEQAMDIASELTGVPPKVVRSYIAYANMAIGEFDDAVRQLRVTTDDLVSSGSLAMASTEAALLALALLHIGQVAEAQTVHRDAAAMTSDGDILSETLVAAGAAWLAAEAGDGAGSRACATDAERLPGGELLFLGVVQDSLAEAAARRGDLAEAERHRRAAVAACAAKRNLVGLARQQERLAALGTA